MWQFMTVMATNAVYRPSLNRRPTPLPIATIGWDKNEASLLLQRVYSGIHRLVVTAD
jgi:hypothetical protein